MREPRIGGVPVQHGAGAGDAGSFPSNSAAIHVDSCYLEYLFAILLAISILAGLKVIGALMVAALVVVPAAAARTLARSTHGYLLWSVAVAFLAGAGGLGISTRPLVPTGGAVVLAASLIFFLTLAIGTFGRGRHRGVSTGSKPF